LPVLQTTGCPFNNCLQFASTSNSVGNYLDCGSSNDFKLTKYYTLELWIYRTADSGTWERLISKSNVSGYDYWMQISSADKISTGLIKADTSAASLTGNTVITLNTWHHVVAVKDATKFYLYLDGVLDGSGLNGTMGDVRTSTSNLYIGRLSSGAWNYSFNGSIDDVRIYNDALTVGQIRQNYLAGVKNLLAKGQTSEAEYANRLDVLDQCVAIK